eukprot:2792945-Rhodomonas_salina.1
MKGLAQTQVVEKAVAAEDRCLTWDGLKDRKMKNLLMHIGVPAPRAANGSQQEPDALFCWYGVMKNGSAEAGAETIMNTINYIKEAAMTSGLVSLYDQIHVAMGVLPSTHSELPPTHSELKAIYDW